MSIEILSQELVLPEGITGTKTYDGKPYQVWELPDADFERLCTIPDDEWKDEWGMWRQGSSNMGSSMAGEVLIGEHIMSCWERDLEKLFWWYEDEGKELPENYDPKKVASYDSVFEYLCEELGASQPRNVCALCTDLAKMNNCTLAELFVKFGGPHA